MTHCLLQSIVSHPGDVIVPRSVYSLKSSWLSVQAFASFLARRFRPSLLYMKSKNILSLLFALDTTFGRLDRKRSKYLRDSLTPMFDLFANVLKYREGCKSDDQRYVYSIVIGW